MQYPTALVNFLVAWVVYPFAQNTFASLYFALNIYKIQTLLLKLFCVAEILGITCKHDEYIYDTNAQEVKNNTFPNGEDKQPNM